MIRGKRIAALFFVVMLLLAAASGCGLFGRQNSGPGVDPGPEESMSNFSAPELFSGEIISFPGDFEGRVVYLVFFANG